MLTAETRMVARQLVDRELRRRLGIRASTRKALASQCHGMTFLGGRCQNTATDGVFCYAHKETA